MIKRAQAGLRDSLAPLAFGLRSSESGPSTNAEREAKSYLHLARVALDAQRAALIEAQAVGEYSSEALRAASEALDVYELRLTPPTSH